MSSGEKAAVIGISVGAAVGICIVVGMHIHESAYEQGYIDQIHADFEREQAEEKERTNGGKHSFTFHLDDDGVTCVSYVDGTRSGWTRNDPTRTGLYWRRAFDNAPDVEYEFIVRRAEVTDAREMLDRHIDVTRSFDAQTERLLKESDADQKEAATRVVDEGDQDGSHNE